MKKLIIFGLFLLAVLAIVFGGNRALEKILDAELAQLLTHQLGIPVTLGPIRTQVSTLTARSPMLVMGNPASPALTASDVTVSLAWHELLRGEIRLRSGSGGDLMIKPSLWPSSGDPLPTDYRFLEPYLPNRLSLESARYVDAQGVSYTFKKPVWLRQSPGATLNWQDQQTSGTPVAISTRLTSLDDLLRLAKVSLQVNATPTRSAEADAKLHSTIHTALDIKPDSGAGYTLTAQVDAGGMSAAVEAGNTAAWSWPDQSTTRIKQIDIDQVRALVSAYRADAEDQKDSSTWLDSPLPRLSLIDHRGKVSIDELRWNDEVGTNSTFDFTTGAQGVEVKSVSSRGPAGLMQGDFRIASGDSGWDLTLNADIQALETDKSLASLYLDSQWFWREGASRLTGAGNTWGTLLNSLQGDIALGGYHRGAAETPVNITASLDNRPGEFALDAIDIQIAKGHITGSAQLSGDKSEPHLSARISAKALNLDFLVPQDEGETAPGIQVPEYLDVLPGVDMNWELDISSLTIGDLAITQTSASFERNQRHGLLTAKVSAEDGSQLNLRLEAELYPDKPSDVSLHAEFDRFNLPKLFGQEMILADSRESGNISFIGSGNSIEEVFEAMKGQANLTFDFRPDRNWKRAPKPEEQVTVFGEATMVISDQRITGLQISKLAIDSVLQNLTGDMSFVDGRKPWLIADFTSDKLDLADLAELSGQNTAGTGAGEPDSLASIQQLGEARFSLRAKAVLADEIPMTDVDVEVETGPGSVNFQQLDFSLYAGRITSRGAINWRQNKAALSVDAELKNVSLDKFLEDMPSQASAPLSGTVAIRSTGSNAAGLLAGITGDVKLTASPDSPGSTGQSAAKVEMTARQTDNGMQATIQRFEWQDTDLQGSVQYHRTTPPLLEVEITGGSLSLLPWEDARDELDKKSGGAASKKKDEGASLLGDIVMTPLRMISGPREAKPGNKVFSSEPLPLDFLGEHQVNIKGKLDKVTSHEVNATGLSFSASLYDGQLDLQSSASEINGGSGSFKMHLGVIEDRLSASATGTFRNLQGDLIQASFPRSGYLDLVSSGNSEAELAANINGIVYLELGKGPMIYGDLMLLTADVATSALGALIPGADKRQPKLECGVTLGRFKDGIGVTPYGYAMRTNQANLVGQISLNLKKELLQMNFSSSSRKGVGLSFGNVFSNTVEVEGPLSDPKVVPNATGLLWRGWAAVLTGGLSVVGESVLKRALASENPCKSVQKEIRKGICGTSKPGANSPMVCPPG